MNIVPIFKSPSVNKMKNLHVGVAIRYEENDAEELVHMLEFIQAQKKQSTVKVLRVPVAHLNGNTVTIESIMRGLQKFNPGERAINGVVTLHFLDEMRALFLAYIARLQDMKETAKKNFDWDESHPFFPTHEHYQKIAELYFPPVIKMN